MSADAPEDGPEVLGSVSMLLQDLRKGDSQAGLGLWNRYLPRLTALAARTLAGRRVGVADADDAVQSAWISFWQRLESGAFPADLRRDEFWKLLGLIVVRKAGKQLRSERAAKRGAGKVVRASELASEPDGGRLDHVAQQLAAADFDLHSEELLSLLDEPCQRIALLRLMGYRTCEIADDLGCTERKIQRKLELIRLKWSVHVGQPT
jgi:RNA polymerase sigma factor (sigma-70 family)